MASDQLHEAIYQRYIEPTRRKRTRAVGLEFEFPIMNAETKPVDFSVIHAMTDDFLRTFSFLSSGQDDAGHIYLAEEPETGDSLSFDCSYNTLEFSFGTEEDMALLDQRFRRYYRFVQNELEKNGHHITGMGINPGYAVNRNVPVVSERYRMLFHHLCSYKNYGREILFHDHPNFGLFSCASQVQLDVEEADLIEVINTFTLLEPMKALLLANSLWTEDTNEFLCSRDYFWRNSLHGLNRHNVDMYGLRFESVEELILYIRSMSIYCVMRDGKYVNFSPIPLDDYFASDTIEGEIFQGSRYEKIRIHPELSDLEYLRSFKFEDLTFRGTVEFRSVCEQPVPEILASGALHAGLMENLHALTDLLENDHVIYHRGYNASEIRRQFVMSDLPAVYDRKELTELLLKILDLAADGLKIRCTDLNFLSIPDPEPGTVFRCQAKIRYHHPAVAATVTVTGDDNVLVRFDTPVRAPAPGQSAVFYDDDRCVIGGGIIA